MSTIAIVIPSLNDADHLARCLRAIAAQSRRPDELIVVDNGSSDDTAEVARAAGARVVDEPVRGIWPATAAGFDAAASDYLARLDADSLPAPGWLAELERRLDAADRPTVVTDTGVFYGNNALLRWIGTYIYLGGYFWFLGLVLGHPPVFGSNYGLRRDAWLELRDIVHRDRADLHDDLDLAWMLRPGMTAVRDRDLVVGISARPFDTWSGFTRRIRMAFHTLFVEMRAWPPLRRRRERAAAAPWSAPSTAAPPAQPETAARPAGAPAETTATGPHPLAAPHREEARREERREPAVRREPDDEPDGGLPATA